MSGYDGSDIQGISIHALVKRATYTASYTAEMCRNFNPRPRKEGDGLRASALALRGISIHALVKRATPRNSTLSILNAISIHALVKRATQVCRYVKRGKGISIHALVKRATI